MKVGLGIIFSLLLQANAFSHYDEYKNIIGFSVGLKNHSGTIGMEYTRQIDGIFYINFGAGIKSYNGAQFTLGLHTNFMKEKIMHFNSFLNFSQTTGENVVFLEDTPESEFYFTKPSQALHFGLGLNFKIKSTLHTIRFGYKKYLSLIEIDNLSSIKTEYTGLKILQDNLKDGFILSYSFSIIW